jgi:hypothetical protein
MSTLLCSLILVLVVGAHCKNNSTLVEEFCINCTSNFENFFLKTIWFPIAPQEYLCVNKTSNLSQHMLIIDVVCKPEMCKGITKRRAVKLFDPEILTCGCDETKTEEHQQSSHQTIDIALIIIAVLVFITTGIKLLPGRFNRLNGLIELIFQRGVVV